MTALQPDTTSPHQSTFAIANPPLFSSLLSGSPVRVTRQGQPTPTTLYTQTLSPVLAAVAEPLPTPSCSSRYDSPPCTLSDQAFGGALDLAGKIHHTLIELVRQRFYGIA